MLVIALYAIFALDLKLIRWEEPEAKEEVGAQTLLDVARPQQAKYGASS